MLHGNLPSGPKHRGSLQKNGFEGSKQFADDFRAYLGEANADILVDI